MCSHQIIRRNDYASFNILGLAIIFILGGLTIILDLTLSTIVNKIQQATRKGQHRIREWRINGTLNLQRIALGKHGARLHNGSQDPLPVAMMYENTFESKLPPTTDAAQAKKPTISALSRLLSPMANQLSVSEIKERDNDPPTKCSPHDS